MTRDEARDTAWDALDEIHAALRGDSTDASKLDLIGAIIANGPLDTAPGGPREDECARLRGEVERLRARERELEDALRLIAETDWVDAVLDPDRALRVARAVLESSSDAPVDVVQPDGYATHTTCAACGGTKFEAIMDPEAGACRSCSGSGRVPVVSLEQEDNR